MFKIVYFPHSHYLIDAYNQILSSLTIIEVARFSDKTVNNQCFSVISNIKINLIIEGRIDNIDKNPPQIFL
jgi:hypothetical protein